MTVTVDDLLAEQRAIAAAAAEVPQAIFDFFTGLAAHDEEFRSAIRGLLVVVDEVDSCCGCVSESLSAEGHRRAVETARALVREETA